MGHPVIIVLVSAVFFLVHYLIFLSGGQWYTNVFPFSRCSLVVLMTKPDPYLVYCQPKRKKTHLKNSLENYFFFLGIFTPGKGDLKWGILSLLNWQGLLPSLTNICESLISLGRLGQIRLGQVRSGQVRLSQVRLSQVRLGQVRLVYVSLSLCQFRWTLLK